LDSLDVQKVVLINNEYAEAISKEDKFGKAEVQGCKKHRYQYHQNRASLPFQSRDAEVLQK